MFFRNRGGGSLFPIEKGLGWPSFVVQRENAFRSIAEREGEGSERGGRCRVFQFDCDYEWKKEKKEELLDE